MDTEYENFCPEKAKQNRSALGIALGPASPLAGCVQLPSLHRADGEIAERGGPVLLRTV